MDRIGRKQTMTLGFFLWAIMGFIIGGALRPIQTVFPLFVVLYGIFNSFGEMGPGVSTLFLLTLMNRIKLKRPNLGRYLSLWSRVFPNSSPRSFSWLRGCCR
jgi:hypothetical protein